MASATRTSIDVTAAAIAAALRRPSQRSPQRVVFRSAPELPELRELIGTRAEVLACMRLQSAARAASWRRRRLAAAIVLQYIARAYLGRKRAAAAARAEAISEVIGTREEVLACLRLQSAVRTREWRRRSLAAARVIQQRHRAAHEDSLSRRTTHQGQGAREPLRRAKSSGA